MSEDATKDKLTTELSMKQETAIAVQKQKQSDAMVSIFGDNIDRELHNFDGDSRRIWTMKALCSSPEVAALEESAGQPLKIKYFYGSRYDHVDDSTGEIQNRLRMVLVCDDGKCWRTSSPYVAREIGRAVKEFGLRPFDPPLVMRLIVGTGRDNHKFHTLGPVL